MNRIQRLTNKYSRLAIGLMSGTCTDGIDAALVQIEGCHLDTKVTLIDFITIPYEDSLRNRLLDIASGNKFGSEEICKMNFLLGHLSLAACIKVCEQANVPLTNIDFVGSHGHTIFHQPIKTSYFGYNIASTLQIGEPSIISETLNCPVISDFRVRDMAAGGLGAPLVPYTEYLLYSKKGKNIALQNIGGIGNITFLPANNEIDNVFAFDTGPGNMIIDALVSIYTNGTCHYDKNGEIAASAFIHHELLNWLLEDEYIYLLAPKTTGREYYGQEFVSNLLKKADSLHISLTDTIATATMFTAKSIEIGIKNNFKEMPDELVIGGGGSYNKTLLNNIKRVLPNCKVITNEDLGLNSNAKEAIAFAVLANETLSGKTNNIPSATGAHHSVIMGKITL